jgi:large subunit ribosomal protein L4
MIEPKVYSTSGQEIRTITLADSVFGLPDNGSVIWYAVNNELANRRLGTAHTKDRSEVHGSNAKPYKQKGTGRARRGDKKSPITVGGGVIFGPRHRDFSYVIPKKMKRLATKTILSLKVANDMLKVVEDFSPANGKTKELASVLKNWNNEGRIVLVVDGADESSKKIRRAAANLPTVDVLAYNALSAHTLFYARRVVILESTAKKLCDFYTKLETRV